MRLGAPRRMVPALRDVLLCLTVGMAPLAASGSAAAQAPSVTPAPAVPAPPADGGLSAPPLVNPRGVESVPVSPGGGTFAAEEVELPSVPVLIVSGTASWDDAYDSLVGAAKAGEAELSSLGLTRAGEAMVVYTESDDRGFSFELQLPFSGATTKKPAGTMKLGASQAGKMLKFRHAGTFADMDNTYELIFNYLDLKNLTAGDFYIERYRTDILTAAPEALEIDIFVPVQ
ncbi:GyrI-like domain-containing protein [Xanthobacter tagetidis]|nr:GyrI-like domain-containing protein [Xanthobacter tagetidis]MBB6308487.1 effector-binding domain-containing protein [Xanthobacter tagetidis]